MDRTTSMLATTVGKRLRRGMVLAVLVVALMAALMPSAAFASSRHGRASYSHNHYSHHHQHNYKNRHVSKKHPRCATTYRVRRGDTLTKIARHYRTSIHSLAKANGIRNVNRIIAGQTLCIR